MVRWILPVKAVARGKSRLSVRGVARADLVLAMLEDTLTAVIATGLGEVVIVSPDPAVGRLAQAYRVQFHPHPGALNHAVAAVCPPDLRCAAVLPDLPAVRAQDLAAVVTQHSRGFVADAGGTGTTMALDTGLIPRFGPGSAAAFRADGLPLLPAAPGLRRDVDTADDLAVAQSLGLGAHTAAVLERAWGRPDVRTGPSRRC